MQFKTRALQRHPISPATGLILMSALLLLGIGWLVGPIPQDLAYHSFADQRTLISIPHANDVLTNLPFCLFGITGLCLAWKRRDRLDGFHNHYLAFFLGVLLTGFGSAYYHYAPDNATLVWDRLPMALGFMSLFALIFAERIDRQLGNRLFPWLLIAGIGSVLFWHLQDDLRPYLLVQFGTMLVLPFILTRFRRGDDRFLWLALAFYVLAKIFEAADEPIYLLTSGFVSGHSLKHLAAALAPLMILLQVNARSGRGVIG